MSGNPPAIRKRILDPAFNAFMWPGYRGASTAQITRLARVSERDLYANFGGKQAMLAGCMAERAELMRRPLAVPAPADRDGLHRTLIEFGIAAVRELSGPEILATGRLAMIEAEDAPDVAVTLDRHGRAANAEALTGLLTAAREQGLLGESEPADVAGLFLSVVMAGGIPVRMLMRGPHHPTTRRRGAYSGFMGCPADLGADQSVPGLIGRVSG